jgi:hypothetical protein
MSSYESAGHDTVDALIKEFAQVARGLHVSGGFEDSLRRLTATAVVVIAGCESASISLLENTGAVTWGATDQFARDADQIQYDEGEGPGLDAAIQERWIYTADLADDARWPRCGARLRKLGVGSMFSCRLALDAAPDHRPGGLNLYASTPQAFDTRDQMLAILLSSLGAVLVDAARQQQQLHNSIESHQVIGEAIGLMRAKANVSSLHAFDLLANASQRTNIGMRDLARQVADGTLTGREPPSTWPGP